MTTLEKYCTEFIEKTFPEKKGLFSFIGRKKREQQKKDMFKLMATQFTTVAETYHDIAVKNFKVLALNKCSDTFGKHTKKIGKGAILGINVNFKP